MQRNRGGILGSALFLFGLIFGGFITLLLSTDEKGETRETIKDRIGQLKSRLKEATEAERVKEIFGRATREATARYEEARELLIEKLANLKVAVEDIDKDKYKAVVEDVVAELKKEGSMTASQLKKLSAYLAEDYKKVTRKADPEEADEV